MATVGFTKEYSAGDFDSVALTAMFATLKGFFEAAGFVVILDQADAFEVLPAGHAAGTISDDIPHWRIEQGGGSYPNLRARAIWGINDDDIDSRSSHTVYLLNADTDPQWASYRAITFAADGSAGWWWLISKQWDAAHPEWGNWFEASAVASKTRRYAADFHVGLVCRYGIYDGGDWRTPYAIAATGTINTKVVGTLWSPLAGMQRHAASPLPRLVAPLFCEINNSPGAHLQGEIEHIMKLTSGYAWGEAPLPGWWAFTNDYAPLALPAPTSFTAL
jgi:hypothetical protein